MPIKLPLLGSNQDSPDPESAAPPVAISKERDERTSEADPNGARQSHDFSHDFFRVERGRRVGKAERNRREFARISAAFGGRCAYCGVTPTLLMREHMYPTLRGGGDELENIVPACGRCNSQKGCRTPLEWFLGLTGRSYYNRDGEWVPDVLPAIAVARTPRSLWRSGAVVRPC